MCICYIGYQSVQTFCVYMSSAAALLQLLVIERDRPKGVVCGAYRIMYVDNEKKIRVLKRERK